MNRLTSAQVNTITALHALFARRLNDSLGAHLRVAFEMNLVSAEQLNYREFTSRLPEVTYFASVHVMPNDARVAIHCDLAPVYPIIDALLGGSGAQAIDLRDLTEIEEQMFQTIVALIVQDLCSTWASVSPTQFHI